MMFKKFTSLFILLIVLINILSLNTIAFAAPDLNAKAAVLIDLKTGNVLFEKNADKKVFPASTTKIMTALIALEKVKAGELSLEQPITYTESANSTMDIDGSNIALKVGEQMVLGDLLRGLLISSGNDAAAIIAEYIGNGNIENFVVLMNEKAKALGLKGTHFKNPHGLHHEENYTTAIDMAKLAREAMKNETFRSIVECAHVRLAATNMQEERYYINTNNLVSRMRYPYYFYEYATGIKTGSTDKAGYCLVSSAKKDNKEFIAAVFGADGISESHTDSKNLLEYGMQNYAAVRFAKVDDIYGEISVKQAANGQDHVLLSAKDNLDILFPKNADKSEVEVVCDIPEKVYAPIKKGQVIGKVNFVYNSKVIGSVDLAATTDIKRHLFGFVMSFGEWLWSFKGVRIFVYSVIAVVVAFISLVIYAFSKALKKSKSKKRRQRTYHPPRY